jgi:type III pantothenate kinase
MASGAIALALGSAELMLLVVDIGNTNVVLGLYDGTQLLQTFRISSSRTRTADEYGLMLYQLARQRDIDVSALEGAIIASVVPPLTETLASALRSTFAREPMIVGPGLKTGISVLYENPREVGADRIVNAVAAHERAKAALIVVDFGTATTFDCVSAAGEYLGGVIVPGILVSLDGLLARAAKLTRVEVAEPPRVLGRNTTHALQSGIIFGYASMVDGLIERLTSELGGPMRIYATGGLAPLVAKHTRSIQEVCPELTLEGLRLIYERNRRAPTSSGSSAPRRSTRPEST